MKYNLHFLGLNRSAVRFTEANVRKAAYTVGPFEVLNQSPGPTEVICVMWSGIGAEDLTAAGQFPGRVKSRAQQNLFSAGYGGI